MPPNGLVIYCGTIVTDEGKEKKVINHDPRNNVLHLSFFFQVNIDFEPFKPINTSLYLCDNKFHTGWLVNLIPLAFASNNYCSLYELKKSPCLFSYCSLLTRGSDGATSWRQQIWFHCDGRQWCALWHTSGITPSDSHDCDTVLCCHYIKLL